MDRLCRATVWDPNSQFEVWAISVSVNVRAISDGADGVHPSLRKGLAAAVAYVRLARGIKRL